MLYMLGTIFFFFFIGSVFNGGFGFSMKVLWIPIGLLVFGFTWVNREFSSTQYNLRTGSHLGGSHYLLSALVIDELALPDDCECCHRPG